MSEESGNILYLREHLAHVLLQSQSEHGDDTIVIGQANLLSTVLFLRNDLRLKIDFLSDITAVDYFGIKKPRFEVVYHLYSLATKVRLRLKVVVSEEDPVVDSLVPIWKAANWMEREVWDMYGISFSGHPGLRRILLYEGFQGHPLRKDYPVNQCQPLVPLREIEGTFVDQRSETKLLRLRQQMAKKS
jgi:NADH-quinone oxidoreductase subunit C